MARRVSVFFLSPKVKLVFFSKNSYLYDFLAGRPPGDGRGEKEDNTERCLHFQLMGDETVGRIRRMKTQRRSFARTGLGNLSEN